MVSGAAEKVVLVTGCAKGGIGFEYCRSFKEAGCSVYATDIGSAMGKMEELRDMGVVTLEMDVSNEESVKATIARVTKDAGNIHVVVNNAGIGTPGPLAELPLQEVERVLNVNVLGTLRVVQAAVPLMVASGGGTIVNVSSVVAWVPTPWAGAYCASKAALQSLSDSLRVELRPFNINVMVVSPGAIQSNLGAHNLAAASRLPSWSLYAPFADAILMRAKASQTAASTPAHCLAKAVVSATLSPYPPPRLVFGHMTTLLTLLSFSPIWIRDLFMSRNFGLAGRVHKKAA